MVGLCLFISVGFHYYGVPLFREPEIARAVVVKYLNGRPLSLCEHPEKGKRCRFYLDIDFDGKIEKLMSCAFKIIRDKVKVSLLNS